jgi:RNAse (barnase) inhibitor barstar
MWTGCGDDYYTFDFDEIADQQDFYREFSRLLL